MAIFLELYRVASIILFIYVGMKLNEIKELIGIFKMQNHVSILVLALILNIFVSFVAIHYKKRCEADDNKAE